jgi:hypothetical protein
MNVQKGTKQDPPGAETPTDTSLGEVCGPAGGIVAAGFIGGGMGLGRSGGLSVLPTSSFLSLFATGMVLGLLLTALIQWRAEGRLCAPGVRCLCRLLGLGMMTCALAWVTAATLSAVAVLIWVGGPIALLILIAAVGGSGAFVFAAARRAHRVLISAPATEQVAAAPLLGNGGPAATM